MDFIGYFIRALAHIFNMVLTIYMWVIVARAVLSWVNPDPYNPIVRFIHNVTEPVLAKLRSRLPLYFGGIDFTPMVLILAIIFLTRWMVPYLDGLGASFLRP
jgi:YggT family protein